MKGTIKMVMQEEGIQMDVNVLSTNRVADTCNMVDALLSAMELSELDQMMVLMAVAIEHKEKPEPESRTGVKIAMPKTPGTEKFMEKLFGGLTNEG